MWGGSSSLATEQKKHLAFAEMHLLHCMSAWNILLVGSDPVQERYLNTLTPLAPFCLTVGSSPLRLIPDMKHLFRRHEAQFLRLSLSMVQSLRLAHRWFCLPGCTSKHRGMKTLPDDGRASTQSNKEWVFADNIIQPHNVRSLCPGCLSARVGVRN